MITAIAEAQSGAPADRVRVDLVAGNENESPAIAILILRGRRELRLRSRVHPERVNELVDDCFIGVDGETDAGTMQMSGKRVRSTRMKSGVVEHRLAHRDLLQIGEILLCFRRSFAEA